MREGCTASQSQDKWSIDTGKKCVKSNLQMIEGNVHDFASDFKIMHL